MFRTLHIVTVLLGMILAGASTPQLPAQATRSSRNFQTRRLCCRDKQTPSNVGRGVQRRTCRESGGLIDARGGPDAEKRLSAQPRLH
jgi:hypothetical protein